MASEKPTNKDLQEKQMLKKSKYIRGRTKRTVDITSEE